MEKHLSEYTRDEIIRCLLAAGYSIFQGDDTETLRSTLNLFIQDGIAPTIEHVEAIEFLNSYVKD